MVGLLYTYGFLPCLIMMVTVSAHSKREKKNMCEKNRESSNICECRGQNLKSTMASEMRRTSICYPSRYIAGHSIIEPARYSM
jgi:hypothetical protein